jgi:hypothetical protein
LFANPFNYLVDTVTRLASLATFGLPAEACLPAIGAILVRLDSNNNYNRVWPATTKRRPKAPTHAHTKCAQPTRLPARLYSAAAPIISFSVCDSTRRTGGSAQLHLIHLASATCSCVVLCVSGPAQTRDNLGQRRRRQPGTKLARPNCHRVGRCGVWCSLMRLISVVESGSMRQQQQRSARILGGQLGPLA